MTSPCPADEKRAAAVLRGPFRRCSRDSRGARSWPVEATPCRRSLGFRVTRFLGFVVALTGWITPCLSTEPPAPTLLEGGRYLRPDGTLSENPGILIVNGKIGAVGVGKVPADSELRRVQLGADSVVSPGLIDLLSAIGGFSASSERTVAVDPDLSRREAVDPVHRDLGRALASGVTTVLVGGARANLVDGVAVTFRTALLDGELDVLRDDGPLLFGLGPSVVAADRDPSSRASAVEMLRRVLEGDGATHPRLEAHRRGELDGLAWAESVGDLEVLLDLLSATSPRKPAVAVDPFVWHRCRKSVADKVSRVILGPYSTLAPALPSLHGVWAPGLEPAFSGMSRPYSAETPRRNAALAVRLGMPPDVARRALTANAADIAGVADRVGRIGPGLEADLVVFSDDPLRVDSRIEMVFVRGRRVILDADVTGTP